MVAFFSAVIICMYADREWFKQEEWNVQNQSPLTFKKFIKSDRFGKGKEDKEPHLSLIPEPFVGNLQNAEIFILLMKPGFSSSVHYAHENPAFRDACIKNLRQENGNLDFPLFYLNPEFAWSSGFRLWEALLSPILSNSKLRKQKQLSTIPHGTQAPRRVCRCA
jgi:hypothetical protein